MDTKLTESDIRALAADSAKLAIYELAVQEKQLGLYAIFLGDGARMKDLPDEVQRLEGSVAVYRGGTVVCLETAQFLDRPDPGLMVHVLRRHKVVDRVAVFENDGNDCFAAAFRAAFAMVEEYEEERSTQARNIGVPEDAESVTDAETPENNFCHTSFPG